MRRLLLLGTFLYLLCTESFSQLLMTKTGVISFHSHTILEDIEAENQKVFAVIDLPKKNIAFTLLMKEFVFPRKLMQEHFNENYAESDKYPKATFNGLFTETLIPDKNGSYPVNVKGKLTIHGVSNEVSVSGILTIQDNLLIALATFKLNPTDYNISIPFIVREKIEKENTVRVKIDWIIKK